MRLHKSELVYQIFLFTAISILMIFMVFPLVYVVGQSFLSKAEWVASGGKVIIPTKPTIYVYAALLGSGNALLQSFKVSFFRTVIVTFVSMFFTMTFGYVLSRKHLPFKRIILFMLMVSILFPTGLIPNFLVLLQTNVYNTFFVYLITGLVGPFGVLVFRQFFLGLPDSVEESARIDGASEIKIMWAIAVPMSTPVVAALSLFTAVGQWNSWFDAAVFIKDVSLKPFQLILRNMMENPNLAYQLTEGQAQFIFDPKYDFTPQALRMAITVMGTVPILCVYPFLQKYFTKGMYMGAVKE